MKKIGIQEVDDGMILGEPVKNAKGEIVFDQRVKLNSEIVGEIFSLGVTEVIILTQEDDHKISTQIYELYDVHSDTELREAIKLKIDDKFETSVKGDPLMQEIKKLALKFSFRKYNL